MNLSILLKGINILGISGPSGSEVNVSSVCYNSRQCTPDSLFVAIRGLKSDGHEYIDDAVRCGAKVIVCEKEVTMPPEITVVRVENGRRTLGLLARNFYADPSRCLVAVAVMGTNGKTTVTYILESIFQAAGFSCGVLGTVNYRYPGLVMEAPNTTPESLDLQRILREMVDHGVTHLVAEVSSHAVDLRRIDDCDFDLGIFTNLTQDHLDYHKTMENYFQAKKRFFSEVLPGGRKQHRYAMAVNADDPWGKRLIRETGEISRPLTFGIEEKADVRASSFDLSLDGIRAEIVVGSMSFDVDTALIGKFNLYNVLAAVSASVALRVPIEAIRRGVRAMNAVPGRLEKVSGSTQPDVFVDYAHTDDALRRVLQSLSPFKRGRIITVFGCGGDRDRGKRPLMGKVATNYSDLTILTSDNPRSEDPLSIIRDIEVGINSQSIPEGSSEDLSRGMTGRGYVVIPDRREAIGAAIRSARPSDIVLIAGKGHEDYQIIGEKRLFFDDRAVAKEFLQNT
ncbi:MAG: UDP-N-acetylmuramoyl-L-alanyl-D-glutamate--L-lysine ligase [Syntrophus sp. PtaB.Bin075]|nr:MAG: UDP-N-acetylmuramoyl-L-alanyl-D-glutamate--L-lysine ligase [Syntrophus sp. PtaB.Bin075]